ncbi:hypothetical protein D9M72_603620 [compost metagenome]
MYSIKSEPVKKAEMKALGNPAMMISIALRKTWPYSTWRSLRPLARAVVTYCFLISSMNEFLVSSVVVAKAESKSVISGSVMCQK